MDETASADEPASKDDTALTLRSVTRLSEIDRDVWDALANPPGEEFDPFLSWDFLQALEESGCAVEETGWGPRHLLLENKDGRVLAALPLYLKGHSQGEYVFDHGWADAFERAGGQYYPKLLTAVPFTPVTGRRLLAANAEARKHLIAGVVQLAGQWGIATWHLNFPTRQEWEDLGALGLLKRLDRQFIWSNRDYASYEDFLADLSSRKRKALRKERRAAREGVEIEHLSGADLQPEHWDVFFQCYQQTGSRKWGYPYLNREFFDLIHQRMADRILLVMAKADGRYRFSAQFHRVERALRTLLGTPGRPALPAFRTLLPPGHRRRDRARSRPGRGRRPGRTQIGPRLQRVAGLLSPLHLECRLP